MKLHTDGAAGKSNSVEEEHPLKQGLKPGYFTNYINHTLKVEEEHPLKQGLKPFLGSASVGIILVEEEHPLKQGLKPYISYIRDIHLIVEEEHPLKQGLKLLIQPSLSPRRYLLKRNIH